MTAFKIVHDTFTIERTYHASPRQVFAAWANVEAKRKWFGGPSDKWKETERKMDFRVGGQERAGGTFTATGMTTMFSATYLDIVDQERIVYAYDMFVGGEKISISLTSIELRAHGEGGTRMVVTEQGAYFDSEAYKSHASRLAGTQGLMERFDASIDEPVGGR
jgi:uncharacterized protein YndB with AHSA1/START domain